MVDFYLGNNQLGGLEMDSKLWQALSVPISDATHINFSAPINARRSENLRQQIKAAKEQVSSNPTVCTCSFEVCCSQPIFSQAVITVPNVSTDTDGTAISYEHVITNTMVEQTCKPICDQFVEEAIEGLNRVCF